MTVTPEAPKTEERGVETGRLEAFSDGVFAVAITLLALDLTVPAADRVHSSHELAVALLDRWPSYVAYVLSFLTILIMWINHHTMFQLIGRIDRLFLLLNGFLLLLVTTFPFATNLAAEYLARPELKAAVVVYSGLNVFMALAFNRMWAYASGKKRLLNPNADPHQVLTLTAQYRFGPHIYLFAFLLAFISPKASFGLICAFAIFFAIPNTALQVTKQ